MGLFGPDDTLIGLLGHTDNSQEPMPNINRRETIFGLIISFMVLSYLCVAFRLWTRFAIVKSAGWDDLFVVLSLMSITPGMVTLCIICDSGFGRHFITLTPDEMAGYFRGIYIANASYTMSTGLIKMSLLLQYLRMYTRGTFLYNVCRSLLVFVGLWGAAYSALAWVPCSPVHLFWDRAYAPFEMLTMNCYAYGSMKVSVFTATYESHAAVNMLLDLLVMALPIPLYFQPNTPFKSKLGLVMVVLMGTVVNIFSVWRFATMLQHRSTTWPTFDPTWYGPISIVMAALEIASACICASIPVFWGSIMAATSQFLGQIFVTKEVHVTSQHRFDTLGSSGAGHSSQDAFHAVELQGATLSRETSDEERGENITRTKIEWTARTQEAPPTPKFYELWAGKTG
ncbi:hypothetical protein B0H63DRAFT_442776 [Podospora didyma]|uniref:Rhodopsin domain-containing protein n=1 Tax=Podospora didyma TaxID=330526 RepID=A0AAE0N3G9_9PEZI|nr:hypothetical protein B0H63DRAFT_442776 [Podospora didyma]